jgi:cytoskeletal protein RodZ
LDIIAEKLKETREEAGIDIEEAGNDLDINPLILMNLEEGKIGAFKDIFTLKEYLTSYSKYLGLDSEKIIDEFNEYLFEYTSKIPVKEIEKTIKENTKEDESISSPYTMENYQKKSFKKIFFLIYVLIFVLVILAIYWSVNQITINNRNAYVISYGK